MHLPANPSQSFIRRNPALYGLKDVPRPVEMGPRDENALKPIPAPKKAIRVRQSSKIPNKLETAFFDYLDKSWPEAIKVHQKIIFEIASGCRYTPDVVVFGENGGVFCYEVKGFMRDDAAVKIKVAARQFPHIFWKLAWRVKGEWQMQDILP